MNESKEAKADVLLGLQWGDEGKGKGVDALAPSYNIIARFQGGPNAGHTLEFDGTQHTLHVIPSGIFRKGVKNFMGNGELIDPIKFKKEVESLLKSITIEEVREKLFISKGAHIILPTGILIDRAQEEAKGANKNGTTLCAMGPTYEDKTNRSGIRVGHILLPDFQKRIEDQKNKHIKRLGLYLTPERITQYLEGIKYALAEKTPIQSIDEKMNEFMEGIEFLRTFQLVEIDWLNDKIRAGKNALEEGAQGSRLDIDFGDGRFVTSSNTTIGGVINGSGITPHQIGEIYGLFKAYCTRVGSGPFPTEQDNAIGEKLRKEGREFGATTGRPRRCGWLDLPALKNAIKLNGGTQLIMTKADVLSACGFEKVLMCVAYDVDGTRTDKVPFEMAGNITPIYKEFKPWKNVMEGEKISDELVEYIKFIEDETNVPITIVSMGPDRSETIFR